MAATIYTQGVDVEALHPDFRLGQSVSAKQHTSEKIVEDIHRTQSDTSRPNVRPEDVVECLTVSHLLARDLPIEGDESRMLFCSLTVTDSQMGKTVLTTKGIKTSGQHAWKQELEFHRYHGNPDTMLLSIEVFLRSWFLRRRRLFVANLNLEVQDEDEFEDDSPQWQKLFDANGAQLHSTLRVKLGRKQRLVRDIRAEKRKIRLRRLAAFALFASVLSAILFPVLWPRGCDADCRGEWRSEVALLGNRSNFAAAVHQSRMYVLGGCCDLETVESFGAEENLWRSEPLLPSARIRLGAASVQGELWAIGGLGEAGVASFDGSEWRVRTPLPTLHPAVHAVQTDGGVCIFGRVGGAGNVPPSLGGDSFYNQSMVCWQNSSQTWATTSTIPTDRHSYGVASYKGSILVVGGWQHGPSRVVESFDGQTWTKLPDLLEGRYALSVAQSGAFLFAAGGSNGYKTLSSVESFDGSRWRLEVPMTIPRQYHAAVAFQGRVFVLGGSRVGRYGETPEELHAVESFAFRAGKE